MAQVSRPINAEPIELADEPVYDDVTWVSSYEIDPFSVPRAEKVALLTDYSDRLLKADGVAHVSVHVASVQRVQVLRELRRYVVHPAAGPDRPGHHRPSR